MPDTMHIDKQVLYKNDQICRHAIQSNNHTNWYMLALHDYY